VFLFFLFFCREQGSRWGIGDGKGGFLIFGTNINNGEQEKPVLWGEG